MRNVPKTELLTSITPAAVREGDHGAFMKLYHDLNIKVFRFLVKKTGDPEEAKELTQQCFIRLWQFRHTLSEHHPIEKQVYVIAHSLLINHYEKEASRNRLLQRQLKDEPPALLTQDPSTTFELYDQVNNAIAQLPPVRRKILIMKVIHDYSNKEIAGQLAISVKTVEDHVTRAFRRMKEMMVMGSVLLASLYFL